MFHHSPSPVAASGTRSRRAVKVIHRLAGLALAMALSPASLWGATNLVPNPRFDDGIAGWTPFDIFTAIFSGSDLDETGKSESGSLRISGLLPQWHGKLQSDCFPVTPGENVVFGFSAFAPASAGGHEAGALLIFFHDASCALGESEGILSSDLRADRRATTWRPVQGHGAVPMFAHSARIIVSVSTLASPPEELNIDNAFAYQGTTCAETAHVVCLGEDRFRVDARWRIPGGDRGHARLRTFTAPGAPDSGYATFFDAANVELVVKVLDACSYNDRFWVFAAGLTNVEVELTVADTHTGETWSRTNPLSHPFAPIQDTNAFATCPH